MLEKSAAVLVTLILIPAVLIVGLLSFALLKTGFFVSASGMLCVTLCLVLCIVTVNVAVFSKKHGRRSAALGQTYRKALNSGNFRIAAKLWHRGFVDGLRWNLLGQLNLATVIFGLVGLILMIPGIAELKTKAQERAEMQSKIRELSTRAN